MPIEVLMPALSPTISSSSPPRKRGSNSGADGPLDCRFRGNDGEGEVGHAD